MTKPENTQLENREMMIKIKSQLNDYFRYVTLLQKKRSEKSQLLIEDYIKVQNDVKERISFIEETDKEDIFNQHPDIELGKFDRCDEKRVADSIKKIRKPVICLRKKNIFEYLFVERQDIKNFGQRTQMIDSFFFSLKVSSEAYEFYNKTLTDATKGLLYPVEYVLDHGWIKLDKATYNVIACFHSFLTFFTQQGLLSDESKDFNFNFRRVELFIKPYLQIAGYKVNKETIRKAFYTVLMGIPSFQSKLNTIINFFNAIIDTESRGTCFFSFLMAVYMQKFHRFVKLSDLMNHYDIQTIDHKHYNFSPKVLKHIKFLLKSLEAKFKEAEEELFLLKFVDESFQFTVEETGPIPQLFIRMYYFDKIKPGMTLDEFKDKNPINEAKFLKDRSDDLGQLVFKLLRGFLYRYEKILEGELAIETKDGTQNREIFSQWIFEAELNKLNEVAKDIEMFKEMTPHLSVSLDTYLKFNNTGRIEIQKEEELSRLIKQSVSSFYDIAEKMSLVLYNNYLAHNMEGEKILELTQNQDSCIEDLVSNPCLTPFAMNHIMEPSLQGRLVSNVLNEIVVFALNFVYLLKHYPLSIRLIKTDKLIDITEEYINIKSKLDQS